MRYRVSPRVFGLVGVVIIIFRICNRCDDFDVGYQNVALADGTKLVGAPFTTISTEGFNLTDLIPNGYEDNEDLISDIVDNNDGYLSGDEFSFYTCNANGSIAAEYGWVRSYDSENSQWNDDGVWTKKTGKSDITNFKPGEGVFTTCGWYTEGCVFKTAGRALVEARNAPFKDGTFIMSNPISASVSLNKVWPVGYEDNEDLISDIVDNNDGYLSGDEFSFYTCNANGSIAAEYGWVRSYDSENSQWNDDGVWTKKTGKSDITEIASGDALFTTCGWFTEGCAMSFPGIDDSRVE